MGSNESFPPPPPPGQPPQPANWPPQQPGYQPTQQVPATQMYPQQGYVPEATPPKKGNGLLIGGGLVVVAALVGAVVLLMGGDDDKKDTTVTLAPVTSSTLGTATTIGGQITTPPTVAPTDPGTVPPETTAAGDFITINDDTGTFSMVLPNDLEFDTTTIQSTDDVPVIIPSISAADVIDDYNHDDTTFGLTAVSVGPLIGSTPEQVLAFLEPPDGTCSGRTQDTLQTTQGLATRVSLTGCGTGGGNKVLLVVSLSDRAVVLGLYMQGTTDTATLSPAAQYALESMFVF